MLLVSGWFHVSETIIPEAGSTFLPLHNAATLILSVDWGLGWYDPATGLHILTYDDQRNRADTAHARADNAEARVRELEEKLSRLRNS